MLFISPWAPVLHPTCATPGFKAATRQLLRLASGHARMRASDDSTPPARLPALPAGVAHRILGHAARPWSLWLQAEVDRSGAAQARPLASEPTTFQQRQQFR